MLSWQVHCALSTFTCFSVNNHLQKRWVFSWTKQQKSLLSVRCNSNSDGSFRGSHEASSEKGSATWRSIDINISMRFNINIFKQHDQQDQQQARVQAQQAGIAITNLITFKCLNIVLCIGGQQSIKLRSESYKGPKKCIYYSWTHVTFLWEYLASGKLLAVETFDFGWTCLKCLLEFKDCAWKLCWWWWPIGYHCSGTLPGGGKKPGNVSPTDPILKKPPSFTWFQGWSVLRWDWCSSSSL